VTPDAAPRFDDPFGVGELSDAVREERADPGGGEHLPRSGRPEHRPAERAGLVGRAGQLAFELGDLLAAGHLDGHFDRFGGDAVYLRFGGGDVRFNRDLDGGPFDRLDLCLGPGRVRGHVDRDRRCDFVDQLAESLYLR
jgi:hypothetical protein